MNRILLVGVFIIFFSLVTNVSAETTFTFAPSQTAAAEIPTKASTKETTTTVPKELSVLAEWEAKIVALIPQSIKDRADELDKMRVDLAKKYGKLRDTAQAEKKASITAYPGTGQVTMDYSKGLWYYPYYVLAFFFAHPYLFYGALLLLTFLVLRMILRFFNIIV